MEMFGLVEKDYSNMQGVSMEPGTFNSFPCYRLHKDALISQPTKYVQEILLCDSTIVSNKHYTQKVTFSTQAIGETIIFWSNNNISS